MHQPEDVAHGFARAWEQADADAIADLFAEDADFVNVVGFWWTRREQIRHNHAHGFAHIFPGSTLALERVRVRDLGDTAVVHARWRIEGQRMPCAEGRAPLAASAGPAPPAPPTPQPEEGSGERRGILTFVVHRQGDGTWRAVAAQNTDIVPGAQTLMAGEAGLHPVRYG